MAGLPPAEVTLESVSPREFIGFFSCAGSFLSPLRGQDFEHVRQVSR